MPLQYQTIADADMSGGLDQQSPENLIPPTFVQELENMDPLATGQLRTRKGHQTFSGTLPHRVLSASYSNSEQTLSVTLSAGVELTSVSSTPVLLRGQYGAGGAASSLFPTGQLSEAWYTGFSLNTIRVLAANTTGSLTVLASEHGITSASIAVTLLQSDSLSDNSYTVIDPDSYTINKTTLDVTINYTNSTPDAVRVMVLLQEQAAQTGTVYQTTYSAPAGTSTLSVAASTHGLSSFNLSPTVWLDTGSSLEAISPDELTITPAGLVSLTFTNRTGSSANVLVALRALDASVASEQLVAASSTTTLSVTDVQPIWVRPCLYSQDGTGLLTWVEVDSVSMSSAGTLSAIAVNRSTSPVTLILSYEAGNLRSNTIKLSPTTDPGLGADFADSAPQMTLWGLPHTSTYLPDSERGGWVTHLDSYKSEGTLEVVCGLGGNLFHPRTPSTGAGPFYPALRSRVSSTTTLGPAFTDNTNPSTRTRGSIEGTGLNSGMATVVGATWTGPGNLCTLTLSIAGMSIQGTLSTIISSVAGLEDELTVEGMSNSRWNGTFVINSVTSPAANTLSIVVRNPSVLRADWDEPINGGVRGRAGVFTDRLPLTGASKFLANDSINTTYTCKRSSGSTLVISPVTDQTSVPAGTGVFASREAQVVPLRDLAESPTVTGLLAGDVLTYSPFGEGRPITIDHVWPFADRALSILPPQVLGDTLSTITLGSGTTAGLSAGQRVLIVQAPTAQVFEGEHTISALLSDTQFTIETPSTHTDTAVVAAQLAGFTVQLGEQLLLADSLGAEQYFNTPRRWEPIEVPTPSASNNLVPASVYRHLDASQYTDQPFLRSVMVQNNLYLTNGLDEVLKYDGQHLYRAGLFRWQPHLFVTQDSGASGKIVINNPEVSYSALDTSLRRFTVTLGHELALAEGDTVYESTTGQFLQIRSLQTDSTNGYIFYTGDKGLLAPGSGTLTKTSALRYYFRLNLVDANNNQISSATVGADDYVVRVFQDTALHLRLVGMPAWHMYDFDRIEVQIYRTRADQVAPFYRVATLPLQFANGVGYVNFTDSTSDEDLTDLDPVVVAIAGQELVPGLSEPLRAKYLTSADNRLILGNITDYPSLDLRLVQTTVPITASILTASANKRWLFRRDNTDTGTTTQMGSRIAYEFISSSSATTIVPGTALSVSTNSFTVTSANSLAPKDWVYLFHNLAPTTGKDLLLCGWFQISSATGSAFTINAPGILAAGATAARGPDRWISASVAQDVPVVLGQDGNYGMLNGNRDTSIAYEFTAMRRMANAINCTMRQTDTSLSGQASFTPWLIANAGNEFAAGQLLIRQPRVDQGVIEVQLPALSGQFDVFAQQIKRAGSTQVSALERLFPSRVLISYPQFPEMFDSPGASTDLDSISAVDINPADGQQVTSMIPFFGDSAFRAAQKDAIVVVWKQNSIYLLNVLNATSAGAGGDFLQKIESEGKGCTFPFSVGLTSKGLMFANQAGIYRLGHDLQVTYAGEKIERVWREQTNRLATELVFGHNFQASNQYKLSIPTLTSAYATRAVVWDHTREYNNRPGSWTLYTNLNSLGWANLEKDAYFCTPAGTVQRLRDSGQLYDYRDGNSAIPVLCTTRAVSFGDQAIRKTVLGVSSSFRLLAEVPTLQVSSSVDLNEEFTPLDPASLPAPTQTDLNGLSDSLGQRLLTLFFSLFRKRGVHVQIRYELAEKDQPLEIAGLSYRVSGLSSEGILQAEQSKSK